MASSLSLEDKLKRLIYLNGTKPQFFVGNPDEYQVEVSEEKLSAISETVANDLQELFPILDAANKDPNLPRRSVIFMFLGRLMRFKDLKPELKSKITGKVLEMVQNDEDFFDFIKYYTSSSTVSKMPSSVGKFVRRFYDKKNPSELAESVAKNNKMFTWSHKDLIKLVHVKSDTPLKNVVINYILTRKVSDKITEEELKVLNILIKSDELKKSKEAVDAIPILTTLTTFTIDQVSSSLHQNTEVWNAAIPNMSIQQILPYLGKLYRLGLLKANTEITRHLTELFTNAEEVKKSNIHPIEVFCYTKRFEKGGKPMDPKLLHHLQHEKKLSEAELKKAQTRIEVKCPHILNALSKCFELACDNITSSNKRILMTIDVTEDAKKAICIGNKALNFLEAAVAFAIVLLRMEKDVLLATYKGDKIDFLTVDKKVSYGDLIKKVQARSSTYAELMAPVEWAASEKRHVDVFVNFIHNDSMGKMPKEKSVHKVRCEPLVKYRSKVNLPNAKSITFAPVRKFMPLWVDIPPNVLNILGFDSVACKVAECFMKNSFS